MTETTKSEDLWNSYKDLVHQLSRYLEGDNKHLSSIEYILKKYKQNFFSLLQNLPKNAKSREELKKGMEEGIAVRGIGYQILSKELYQETLIISDMYNLNEFVALDLLCTAQIQMSYYPGLPRGLVAILLYYDGRKALVTALRMLIQARHGVAWSLNIPEDVEHFITTYTDQLAQNGLFNKILDLLKVLDLTKEIEKLQRSVAFGGPKHRRQVIDSFNSIRVILADCIFIWAVHCGLSKINTISLIAHLKEIKIEQDPTGKIDDVTLYLQTALISALDLSILHTREDGEEIVQNLPILTEKDFLSSVYSELTKEKHKWASEGILAVCLLGFGISLSSLKLLPQGQQYQELMETEENIIEEAISNKKVFEFLINVVLKSETVFKEEFIYRRYHNLLCDFVTQMHPKIRELRIKADEAARTIMAYESQGLEPPETSREFEHLQLTISKLYNKDPLQLHLMLEFWSSLEGNSNFSFPYRTLSRGSGLYKFIKYAGDMIPPTLFVSYLNMLSSLSKCPQAARHCFNLLKHTGPGFNNSLTWDHFFASFNQYYTNLRQETAPFHHTIYRHHISFHKGITPQELQGLQSVLLLIRTIATNDDFSRLAFCEHPIWSPLNVLLGLVSCSVPIPLKADILLTLAALSKSRETSVQMWNILEASQILVTVPSTASYQPKGIQTELDEVESRMETYPLTKSLLNLLDTLIDFGIPRNLGAGSREPGFDPYLNFIIYSVFLKLNSRAYHDSTEKWELSLLCQKIFYQLLLQYSPDISDFPENTKLNKFNSPPGFHIMLQLNSKSEFLNSILFTIDEGIQFFDTYTNVPGQTYIEQCVLYSLNILERTLSLQQSVLELLVSNSNLILFTSLNKLLMSINLRTGKPDHVLNIAKYVGHQLSLPNHCLTAVKILKHLSKTAAIHNQIMNIFFTNMNTSKEIRNGFVECLDVPCTPETHIVTSIKKEIFTLLKQCISYTAPNMTHFLFGFDINRDISQTIFQLPGIMEFPRTCIHSLLGTLRGSLTKVDMDQTIADEAYHMLYILVSNNKTTTPILEFLKMQPNFFQDHITACINNINHSVHQLNQFSWLLKILAIEVKVSAKSNQLIYFKKIAYLLHGIDNDSSNIKDPFCLVDNFENNSDGCQFLQKQNLLIRLIQSFDFSMKEIVTPHWEYFNNNVVDGILKSCQNDENPKLIHIKKLHQILLDDLGSLQNTTVMGQKQAVLQEVQKVLVYAININNTRSSCASVVQFVDAWRQLTEVLVIYTPYEVLSAKYQQLIIISILETLLTQFSTGNLLLEVANYLSGAVLILLDSLRRAFTKESNQQNLNKSESKTNHKNSNSLKLILDKIIQWLLNADVTAQKLKINLYGSIVSFLHLVSDSQTITNDFYLEDKLWISHLDISKYKILPQFALSADVISCYGEKFMEIVCHDCISGQDICKMLAMTSFSLIVTLTSDVSWITYISKRGFLNHIILSVLNSENDLKTVLEPTPGNLHPLYTYESKLCLLSIIATTRTGAEYLLEHKLLPSLSSMKIFDHHPIVSKEDSNKNSSVKDIDPIESRYLQIWLPTLHLCNTIMTTLGTDNQSAISQVMCYLFSHLEVVDMILRSGHPMISILSLRELSLLTSVIARASNNDLVYVLGNSSINHDYRVHLYRIQKLMLNLLTKFLLSDNRIQELNSTAKFSINSSCNRVLYNLKIISNVLLYSRNVVTNHGIDHSAVGVIFQPNLKDTLNYFNQTKAFNDNFPSLGVLIQHLINAINHYHKEKFTMDYLKRRMCEIPDMSSVDLKDIINVPHDYYDLSVMKENALKIIDNGSKFKKMELDYASFIIEHSLFIIWTHLDYYMLKAIPMGKKHGLLDNNFDSSVVSASEAFWNVTNDDISCLKQGLVSIFNDSFSKRLLETTYDHTDADKVLLEVLLRKIKRLIQFVPVK